MAAALADISAAGRPSNYNPIKVVPIDFITDTKLMRITGDRMYIDLKVGDGDDGLQNHKLIIPQQ